MSEKPTQIGIILSRRLSEPAHRLHAPSARTAVFALICAALWAGQAVAVKLAVEVTPPYQVMALRFVLSILTVGLFALVTWQSVVLPRRHIWWVLASAGFVFVQIGLFTVGAKHTSSVHSIVIISSFPFFTALFCYVAPPRIATSRQTLSASILAFAGVLAVFAGELTWAGPADLTGDLMVLASAAVMGARIALIKSALGVIGPLKVVFWEAVVALPLFAATSYLVERPPWPPWPTDAVSLAAIAYQGIAVSGVAFLLWNILLSRHSPNDITVFRLATPVMGVGLGWLILDEPLTPHLLLGAALLIVGMYRVMR